MRSAPPKEDFGLSPGGADRENCLPHQRDKLIVSRLLRGPPTAITSASKGEEQPGSHVCSGRADPGCNLVDLLTRCADEYAASKHDLHQLRHEALAGAPTAQSCWTAVSLNPNSISPGARVCGGLGVSPQAIIEINRIEAMSGVFLQVLLTSFGWSPAKTQF
jgi:hypothetical protein